MKIYHGLLRFDTEPGRPGLAVLGGSHAPRPEPRPLPGAESAGAVPGLSDQAGSLYPAQHYYLRNI